MGKPFSINTTRFDPYKSYAFLVYLENSTTPVAGLSKVTGLKRSSDPIEYKDGGNAIIRKGLGRTKYDAITLERGITHDTDFEDWANSAQVLDKGAPSTSLKLCVRNCGLTFSTKSGRSCCASTCIAAGSRNTRRCPI